jgi:hypothetical protein
MGLTTYSLRVEALLVKPLKALLPSSDFPVAHSSREKALE